MKLIRLLFLLYLLFPGFSFGNSSFEAPSAKWNYSYYSGVSDLIVIGYFRLPDDSNLTDIKLLEEKSLNVSFRISDVIKGSAENKDLKIQVNSNYFEYQKQGKSRFEKKEEIFDRYMKLSEEFRKYRLAMKENSLDSKGVQRYEKLRGEYLKYGTISFNEIFNEPVSDILIKNNEECVVFLDRALSGKDFNISGYGKGIICDKELIQSLKTRK
jgi:hypothetical protein